MTKPKPRFRTEDLVVSALKKLMKNTRWTCRTIVRFVKSEHKISDPWIHRKIARALKRGVRMGLVHMEDGKYRIANSMSNSYTNCRIPIQRNRRCTCVPRRQNCRL